MLLTRLVLPLELRVVGPLLHGLALLLVVAPLPYVPGAVRVVIDTVTIRLIVPPLPLVDVAVGVHEFTITLCEPVVPLPVKSCTVWPLLDPLAVALITLPLPSVLDPVLEQHGGPLDALLTEHLVLCWRQWVVGAVLWMRRRTLAGRPRER